MAKARSKKITKVQRKTILSLVALIILTIVAFYTVQLLGKREKVSTTPTEAAASKCAVDFKVLGGCDAECGANSDCSSGYKCINSACRNPNNPTNAKCTEMQKIGEFEWTSPTLYDLTSSGKRNLTTEKILDLMSGVDRVKVTLTKLESSSQTPEDRVKYEKSTWKLTFSSPSGTKTVVCDKNQKAYECGSLTYDTTASSFKVNGQHHGVPSQDQKTYTGSHEVKVKVEMFSF